MLAVNDLVRIAAAGGGLILQAPGYSVSDLIRIASASSSKRARLILKSAARLSVDDLVRVAAAGGGCVSFEF